MSFLFWVLFSSLFLRNSIKTAKKNVPRILASVNQNSEGAVGLGIIKVGKAE